MARQRHRAARDPDAQGQRRSGGRARRPHQRGSGVVELPVRHRPRRDVGLRADSRSRRRPGGGTAQQGRDGDPGADGQPAPHAARRSQLRVLLRRPVPHRPPGVGLHPRRAEPGHGDDGQALRRQRLRVRALHHELRDSRARAARAVPRSVRGRGRSRNAGDHDGLQQGRRHVVRRERAAHRDDPARRVGLRRHGDVGLVRHPHAPPTPPTPGSTSRCPARPCTAAKLLLKAVEAGEVSEDDAERTRAPRAATQRAHRRDGRQRARPVRTRSTTTTRRASSCCAASPHRAIVLLRNENEPCCRSKTASSKTVAVIGPLAATASTQGGGSAGVLSPYTVSPLRGSAAALGDDVKIMHAPGATLGRGATPHRPRPVPRRRTPGLNVIVLRRRGARRHAGVRRGRAALGVPVEPPVRTRRQGRARGRRTSKARSPRHSTAPHTFSARTVDKRPPVGRRRRVRRRLGRRRRSSHTSRARVDLKAGESVSVRLDYASTLAENIFGSLLDFRVLEPIPEDLIAPAVKVGEEGRRRDRRRRHGQHLGVRGPRPQGHGAAPRPGRTRDRAVAKANNEDHRRRERGRADRDAVARRGRGDRAALVPRSGSRQRAGRRADRCGRRRRVGCRRRSRTGSKTSRRCSTTRARTAGALRRRLVHGLPRLRQDEDRAAVSVRLRPVVHDLLGRRRRRCRRRRRVPVAA